MKSSSEIKSRLASFFKKRPEVQVVYLFGSQATGRVNKMSDIDVAVLVNEKKVKVKSYPYGYKAHLISDLISELQTNKVDVVVLNEAPYFLRHQIIQNGQVVYSPKQLDRIRFHADTMSRYPDIKRLLSVHIGI